MRKLLLLITFLYTSTLFSQEIEILIKENPPYMEGQDIMVEIYLTNNIVDTITYFDSRGPSWDSFNEVWNLSVNNSFVEILSLNGAYDHKFPDSTILTLNPNNKELIRALSIPLKSVGSYSLSYTQEQSSEYVKKKFADNSVSDSLLRKITTFKVSDNIKFKVLRNYDTTIREIINMTWEEWKDYRHAKLYSRQNHFDNMYAAVRYAQDVYALTLFCDKMDDEAIKQISSLKNLRALTLRNYELNYFPEELTELDLYELTIIPKNKMVVSFPYGFSKRSTLRELTVESYGGFPDSILNLKELMYLDISDCPIKTLPNLNPLQNLKVLVANNIEITTINNTGFESLLKLKDLNLSGNKKIDDITPLLSCINLEFLVINRTSISVVPHKIENLNKLKKLSISNGLTEVSDSIGNLSDMRYLSFGGNRKLTYVPGSILKMKKLLHLDLSSTKIEQLPEGITELPLERFLIYNTNCKKTKEYKLLKKRLGKKFFD